MAGSTSSTELLRQLADEVGALRNDLAEVQAQLGLALAMLDEMVTLVKALAGGPHLAEGP